MSGRVDLDSLRAAFGDEESACRLLGLDARRSGRRVFVSCPAHAERTPSCAIETRDGLLVWRCHGCGAGGGVLDLVAAVEGLDIRTDVGAVIRRAAEIVGLRPGDPPRPRPVRPVRATPPPLADEVFGAIVRPLLALGRLDGSTYAADVESYLDGRGLLDLARDDGWAALPPPSCQPAIVRMLRDSAEPCEGCEQPFTARDLERSGLLAGDGLAWSANRLVIPWRDRDGTITTIQRRRIDGGSESKYVFATGRTAREPYGVDRIDTVPPDAPIAIVEGAIDVLALRAVLALRGETALVIGLPGVASWARVAWAELVVGRVVKVAIDADAGGEREVMGLAQACSDAGAKRPERAAPEGAKDWAEAWARETREDNRRAA